MAVRNYTTKIATEKTIMEIETILVKFGAGGIYKEYIGRKINSIMFYIEYKGQKIPFKIPLSIEKTRTIISPCSLLSGSCRNLFGSLPSLTALQIIVFVVSMERGILKGIFCPLYSM